jgi:hypothetical protein
MGCSRWCNAALRGAKFLLVQDRELNFSAYTALSTVKYFRNLRVLRFSAVNRLGQGAERRSTGCGAERRSFGCGAERSHQSRQRNR